MKKAFSGSEKKETSKKEAPKVTKGEEVNKIERVKDNVPNPEAKGGCFVRNVMHKLGNGKRVIFKAGEKLDKKHADYKNLSKHLK